MKVSIIGAAGCIGSSAAFSIATQGQADEMVLIDINKNLLAAHVIDISNAAVACQHDVAIRAGVYEDMAGSDVVIIAVTAATETASRRQALADNLRIISDIAKAIGQFCPNAVVITATNPVEALSYALYLLSPTQDRKKFIGYSLNDSIRFRLWIAEAIGVKPGKVEIIVMGEHGDSQVPIFSSLRVDNQPVSLSEQVKKELRKKVLEYLPNWLSLKVGRTSGWVSGIGLAAMINAIRNDTRELFACSALLAGEYGYEGFSMTVPAILGQQGVHQILEWELSPDERDELEQSASILKTAAHLVEEALGISLGR